MDKNIALFYLYIGSICYTFASFYHLTLKTKWTFKQAYLTSICFVLVEYFFNVNGIKNANRHLSVFNIYVFVNACDLVNLFIFNLLFLKNEFGYKNMISIGLIMGSMLLSSDFLSKMQDA